MSAPALTNSATYRKVYVRKWTNAAFRGLSRDGVVVFDYLLTGPHTNRIGFYRLQIAAAADDLKRWMAPDQFLTAFKEVGQAFGWKFDHQAEVLFIPSWFKWNNAGTGNWKNLSGNLKDLAGMPRSQLDSEFQTNVRYIAPHLREKFKTAARLAMEGDLRALGEDTGHIGDLITDPITDANGDRIGDGVSDRDVMRSQKQKQDRKQEQEEELTASNGFSVSASKDPDAPSTKIPANTNGHPRSHVYCGKRFCVPQFLHQQFDQQLAGRGPEFDLLGWYQQLDRAHNISFVGLPGAKGTADRKVGIIRQSAHVLFAPGDARRTGARHPGDGGTREPVHDPTLYAPEPGGDRRRDSVVGKRAP